MFSKLKISGSVIAHYSNMFLPLDPLLGQRMELVTLEILCVKVKFSVIIFCRGVPGLQLIILAVFGAVELPSVSCTLVHIFEA